MRAVVPADADDLARPGDRGADPIIFEIDRRQLRIRKKAPRFVEASVCEECRVEITPERRRVPYASVLVDPAESFFARFPDA
ncbi:MAG: hypothetical protein WB770_06055 [Acidimicrobiales bacterium]